MIQYKAHTNNLLATIHPVDREKWLIMLREWRREVKETFTKPVERPVIGTKNNPANQTYQDIHRNKEGWSESEDDYVIANHGLVNNARIAFNLRRSVSALNKRITQLRESRKLPPFVWNKK